PIELYPLSLHDALPISGEGHRNSARDAEGHTSSSAFQQSHVKSLLDTCGLLTLDGCRAVVNLGALDSSAPVSPRAKAGSAANSLDRKSTRLNSSHLVIS